MPPHAHSWRRASWKVAAVRHIHLHVSTDVILVHIRRKSYAAMVRKTPPWGVTEHTSDALILESAPWLEKMKMVLFGMLMCVFIPLAQQVVVQSEGKE